MDVRSLAIYTIILALGRGLDLLSTWYVTPNFTLEFNGWMRTAGWRKVILLNLILVIILPIFDKNLCVFLATFSALLALRNFQVGSVTRAIGEEEYRNIWRRFLQSTPWHISAIPVICEVFVYLILGLLISGAFSDKNSDVLWYLNEIGRAFSFCGWFVGIMTVMTRLRKRMKTSN